MCNHIYKSVGKEICPNCKEPTHEIFWNKEIDYYNQWKADNPNDTHNGWWSI